MARGMSVTRRRVHDNARERRHNTIIDIETCEDSLCGARNYWAY